jgi:hypothetical protein
LRSVDSELHPRAEGEDRRQLDPAEGVRHCRGKHLLHVPGTIQRQTNHAGIASAVAADQEEVRMPPVGSRDGAPDNVIDNTEDAVTGGILERDAMNR